MSQQMAIRERELYRSYRKAPGKTFMTELQITLPLC